MKGSAGKPWYKKWWIWLIIVVVVGGIGNAIDGEEETAAPTVRDAAKPVVRTTEPTAPATDTSEQEEPAEEAPVSEEPDTEAPADEPAAEPVAEPAVAVDWRAEIKKIASSDGSPTEKTDAATLLKNKVTIGVDEEKEFRKDIVAEYKSGAYLTGISDDMYALTNIFKAALVEDRSEGTPIGDFAFDFLQNTKDVFRGINDSVESNEEQMEKALAEMK